MEPTDFIIISHHGHNEVTRTCGRGCCAPEHLGTVEAELVMERVASEQEAINHIAALNQRLGSTEHRGHLEWEHRAIWSEHFDKDCDGEYSTRYPGDILDGTLPSDWHERIRAREHALEAERAVQERDRQAREAAARLVKAKAEAEAKAAKLEAEERAEYARLHALYHNPLR